MLRRCSLAAAAAKYAEARAAAESGTHAAWRRRRSRRVGRHRAAHAWRLPAAPHGVRGQRRSFL